MEKVKRDEFIEKLDQLHNLKQWKEYIQNLLKYNDNAVKSAVIRIYNLQEEDERRDRKSVHENNVGFNKVDADFLSRIAYKFICNDDVTKDEFEATRWTMMKYWRQLTNISKANLESWKLQKQLEEETEEEKAIRESGYCQMKIPGLE